jgi:hypothetical protein
MTIIPSKLCILRHFKTLIKDKTIKILNSNASLARLLKRRKVIQVKFRIIKPKIALQTIKSISNFTKLINL